MLCPKIINIEPLNNYKLKLNYETGEVKLFDVALFDLIPNPSPHIPIFLIVYRPHLC